MTLTKARAFSLAMLTLVVLIPRATFAQAVGAIAGTVRDTTRAVLPGVTVVVASSALIEKIRTGVTDGQGNYRVGDLRPGIYTVTFTLLGFTEVQRLGIEVSAGVTANVTADLTVGGLKETITVTSAVSLIDIQNVTAHQVLSRKVIDGLPVTKNWQAMAVLVPGVQVAGITSAQTGQDVGGTVGDRGAFLSVHGSRGGEMPLLLDGLRFNTVNGSGGGNANLYRINTGTIQEITVDIAGLSAEAEVSGVRVNSILQQLPPKGGRFLPD